MFLKWRGSACFWTFTNLWGILWGCHSDWRALLAFRIQGPRHQVSWVHGTHNKAPHYPKCQYCPHWETLCQAASSTIFLSQRAFVPLGLCTHRWSLNSAQHTVAYLRSLAVRSLAQASRRTKSSWTFSDSIALYRGCSMGSASVITALVPSPLNYIFFLNTFIHKGKFTSLCKWETRNACYN